MKGLCECGCGEQTSLAQFSNATVGLVKGQPRRFVQWHNRRKSPVPYIEDAETGCWIWQRAKNDKGYGSLKIAQEHVYAHRYYWEQANERPIPEGFTIDHLCRNPSCVNPEHLEAVTFAENIRRGVLAKYPDPTVCIRGHRREPKKICPECSALLYRQRVAAIRAGQHEVQPKVRVSHCQSGHEFTPENTYWRRDGLGRQCKVCTRERYRRAQKDSA